MAELSVCILTMGHLETLSYVLIRAFPNDVAQFLYFTMIFSSITSHLVIPFCSVILLIYDLVCYHTSRAAIFLLLLLPLLLLHKIFASLFSGPVNILIFSAECRLVVGHFQIVWLFIAFHYLCHLWHCKQLFYPTVCLHNVSSFHESNCEEYNMCFNTI